MKNKNSCTSNSIVFVFLFLPHYLVQYHCLVSYSLFDISPSPTVKCFPPTHTQVTHKHRSACWWLQGYRDSHGVRQPDSHWDMQPKASHRDSNMLENHNQMLAIFPFIFLTEFYCWFWILFLFLKIFFHCYPNPLLQKAYSPSQPDQLSIL